VELTFLYLAIQNIVCIAAILFCKQIGLITTLAPFDVEKGKRWFPVSLLLAGMIYTTGKALQFLSVPVFTIFKNLTIIVIAYGEVLCSVAASPPSSSSPSVSWSSPPSSPPGPTSSTPRW